MSRGEQLKSILDTPEMGIAGGGSVFVVQFRKMITPQALANLEDVHVARRKIAPRGIAMLNLVDARIPLPSDDMKVACARSFRRLASHNTCSATVIAGVGFSASAARSTLRAITLLARPACPSKTFGDIPSAIAWMEFIAPDDLSEAPSIARIVEQWKSRLPAE